ncbi:MAG: hypothetical protein R2764_12510 [Bacteroidales bacterium]
MAIANSEFSFSAQQYHQDDLDHPGKGAPQRHSNDIKPKEIITLNIDYKQMGVGGDNSWGAMTHPEYTLPAGDYYFNFFLIPMSKNTKTPLEISKFKYQ